MTSTKMLLSAALVAGTMSAGAANAQDWYGQIFGGATFADNPNFSGVIGGAANSVFTNLDDGYNLGFAIGRRFGDLGNGVGLRGEIELSFSENDADGFNFTGNGPGAEANPGGDISSTNLFANVYADFDTGGRVTPYLGGGIGVSFVDQSLVYGPTSNVRIDGSDEVFALQLIAGASVDVSESAELFGDVRYIQAYDVAGTRTVNGAAPASVSDDLSSVALNVGLRFNF